MPQFSFEFYQTPEALVPLPQSTLLGTLTRPDIRQMLVPRRRPILPGIRIIPFCRLPLGVIAMMENIEAA